MVSKRYEFTHAIDYKEIIKSNLFFKTNKFAAMAARAVVDLMILEGIELNEPYDPALFKLHPRQMRSIPSKVKTKGATSTPPHPVEAFDQAPSTEPVKAKAKARTKKAKAEA